MPHEQIQISPISRLHWLEVTEINSRQDLAQVALQGPEAEAILGLFHQGVANLSFMQSGRLQFDGVDCEVSRSGYIGEDGFEIIMLETTPHLSLMLCWNTMELFVA